MKTITIQIGNTDDKLTQKEWKRFVDRVFSIVAAHGGELHFFGGSQSFESWQNACWVFECFDFTVDELKKELVRARIEYNQDSIAYIEGATEFI